MTNKPQTIKEIVEEFNKFFQDDIEAAEEGYSHNLSLGKLQNWLRTKLQSLQDEKAEIRNQTIDECIKRAVITMLVQDESETADDCINKYMEELEGMKSPKSTE